MSRRGGLVRGSHGDQREEQRAHDQPEQRQGHDRADADVQGEADGEQREAQAAEPDQHDEQELEDQGHVPRRAGDPFVVNTYTTANQYLPTVAMAGGNHFVVAWESRYQAAPGDGVFAQLFAEEQLFSDGFESGDTLAWSTTVP